MSDVGFVLKKKCISIIEAFLIEFYAFGFMLINCFSTVLLLVPGLLLVNWYLFLLAKLVILVLVYYLWDLHIS
jgi:hypothetical protein